MVSFNTHKNKWEVHHHAMGKRTYVGVFVTEAEARVAYEAYKKNYYSTKKDLNKLAKSPEAWNQYSKNQIKELSKQVRYA